MVLPIPALTEKDREDLAFALEHGVDYIGLSFVQRAGGRGRGQATSPPAAPGS